jgi:hypothetical protein
MKVLLILSSLKVHRAENVEVYRALKQQLPDLTWCAGSELDAYRTLDEGFLYLRPVDPEKPQTHQAGVQFKPEDFDVAIVDQSLDLSQDQSPSLFGGGIANRSLDYEGSDRPSELAEQLTRCGIVCIGTSRNGACLNELATSGKAVLTCPLEELSAKLPSLMEEAQRLVTDNQNGGGLKALTLRLPFDWSIFHAGKDVENRDWPAKVRGTIAIHSAASQPEGAYENSVAFIRVVLRRMWKLGVRIPSYDQLPKGAIIGLVDIVDCVDYSNSRWFEGPLGFTLANPRLLPEPIPCEGKRRFFTVPADVEQRIYAMLSANGSQQKQQ